MILINKLEKSYNGKKVLDIDKFLYLPNNKFISIIGPNGSGKSTLLSCLSRYTKLDKGKIYLNDISLEEYSNIEFAKILATLYQSTDICINITVEELVSFGRYPYSEGNINNDDKIFIDKAIKFLNLEKYKNYRLDQLSGGLKQRALIATILAQNSEYILLDEPLNNLDINSSTSLMKTLRKLVEEKNKTVIAVIHDINYAINYSDIIICIKNGKVIASGETKNIINESVLKDLYETDIKVNYTQDGIFCNYFR